MTWEGKRSQQVSRSIARAALVRPCTVGITAKVSKGSKELRYETGYSDTFGTAVTGLVPADVQTRMATSDVDAVFTVTIPEGTKIARIAMSDADYAKATDLDLALKDSSGQVVGSAGGASKEVLTCRGPGAGRTPSRSTATRAPRSSR